MDKKTEIRVLEVIVDALAFTPRSICSFDLGPAVLYVALKGGLCVRMKCPGQVVRVDEGGLITLPSGMRHELYCSAHERVLGAEGFAVFELGEVLDGTTLREHCRERYSTLAFRARVPRTANPLPGVVPHVIVLQREEMDALPGLRGILDLFMDPATASGLGRTTVLMRLAEMVATMLVHHSLSAYGPGVANVANAAGDPRVRLALELLHQNLAHPWTLKELAERVSLSRSGLAERFKDLVQETPINYLKRVRMHKAADLLLATPLPISAVAQEVGYSCESSFSKAFARIMGAPPGLYRLQNRA